MTEAAGVFRFDDRAGYQAAIGALIAQIDRSLDIVDTDLRDTALDSRLAVEALTRALAQSPQAEVRVVLHDAGPLQHRMPRLWTLCTAQAHRVRIRQTPRTLRHLSETFMLNGSGEAVIRTHHAHWRGKHVRADASEIAGYAGRFAEIWEACSCCISTTKLGL